MATDNSINKALKEINVEQPEATIISQVPKKIPNHSKIFEVKIDAENLASCMVTRRKGRVLFIMGQSQFSFTKKTWTDDEIFQKLRLLLKRTNKTQALHINCLEYRNMKEKGREYVNQILEDFALIQTLSFKADYEINDSGMHRLCQVLRKLRCLQTIELGFSSHEEISNTGIQKLGRVLRNLPSLRNIKLDFSRNVRSFSDDAIISLAQGWKNLVSLQTLDLNFSGCSNITEESLLYLVKSLQKLKSLKGLILNFRESGDASGGLEDLALVLQKLTNLEILHLDFKEHEKVSNTDFSLIGKALSSLKSLKEINFDFSVCEELTDDFVDFTEALKGMGSLKKIALNFGECRDFSRDFLVNLGEAIKSLNCVEDIDMNFADTNDVIEEAAEALLQDLKTMPRIKNLNIDF